MIGTNDINGGKSTDDLIANYTKILQEISINLPDTQVYCMSIIPQNYTFTADADKNAVKILEANARIETLANQFGYTYVDIFDDLADENNILIAQYTDDGLHLNHLGYIVWTNKLIGLLY